MHGPDSLEFEFKLFEDTFEFKLFIVKFEFRKV